MCGASVIQAAAHEHRLAGVVADPGVLDVWLAFPAALRDLLAHGAAKADVNHIWNTKVVPHLTPVERFTLSKRSELFGRPYLLAARAGRMFTDLYDLGQTVMKLNTTEAAPKVTSPALITYYQGDQFYSGPGQARAVYDLLPADLPKAFRVLTIAEGANYHDGPIAPQTRNQVVFDWLDGILR
jgi:hypothetical protein